MLKSWSIENFKPILDSGELKFAPVTVLAGRNSSGKSSLIQSILMVAQTLRSRFDRPLMLNGDLVRLGTVENILSEFSNSHKIALKFELDFEREDVGQNLIDLYRSSEYSVSVVFDTARNSGKQPVSAIEASMLSVENVCLRYRFEFNEALTENNTQEEARETQIVQGDFEVQKIAESELKTFWESLTAQYPRFMSFMGERASYLGKYRRDNRNNVEAEQFLVSLSHFLPKHLEPIPQQRDAQGLRNQIREGTTVYYIQPSHIDDAVEQIEHFFSSKLRYLSPLRPDPGTTAQQFAPTGAFDEVGIKGEYAAVVYHTHKDARIEWYNPRSRQVEQGTLKHALNTWTQYLDVATQVETEVAGSIGITWKVVIKEGQKARTLPEVGGGVSHLLPILVMGLLSPADTFLIVEEPEVTLHPTVQARLGDFFMGLAKCKKQCLIETHSENLVSQLRYHIVEAGGMDKSDCLIYFVDQDEKGAAKFEPVQISARGNILNWPDGFFDETMRQQDRITAASLRQRAKLARGE